MSWDWQKINGKLNTPDFNVPVLLLQEKDDKFYAMVGHLKSIDGNGANWQFQNTGNDIFSMMGFGDDFFGGSGFSTTKTKTTERKMNKDKEGFIPDYWCYIIPPKKQRKSMGSGTRTCY